MKQQNNQLNDFTEKINELEKTIEDKNAAIENTKENYNKIINELQESYSNKISEFENSAKQDFDNIKAEIEKKDEKISELIGLIGNKANIGEYKSNADKAHSERIKWQIATVIIFIVAFALMGLITLFTKDYNIATLARYIVSVILLGMSGYTGKQASNLRKDEVYYRKQQLELSSIDVYLDDIRKPNYGCVQFHTVNDAMGYIRRMYRTSNTDFYLDLDNDAGDYANQGGDYINILKNLESMRHSGYIKHMNVDVHIHSMNVVAVQNMRAIIKANHTWMKEV